MRALQSLTRVLSEEAEALLRLPEQLSESFPQAVDWILNMPGRLITCGVGKSGHIARKAAGTFASTGTPAQFLHAAEAVHGDLGVVQRDDVVLMYTYSGETDELVRLYSSIHDLGARSITLCGRPESSAGRLSQLVLNCRVEREACPNNLAPTTSTTAMLALSDALAVAVMEARSFGPDDFARYHPSGALGKRLTMRVRHVMRAGDDLATVLPSATLADAMRAITKAGAGAVVVVDEAGGLAGFVSDGDLRRYLMDHEGDLRAEVGTIMVRQPSTIEPDLLAVEALEAFRNHPKKIGELPVVESGRVVGLLMLKDLPRAGIV